MECPHCGDLENKVIDSRLTKDRVSIRRRRQCLACSKRFTTYESVETQFLSILIRKKSGHGVTKTSIKTMLSFVSNTLRDLSEEVKTLMAKTDRLHKIQTANVLKKKTAGKTASQKKSPAKKAVAAKPAVLTATGTVLKVIRRSKKGVGIADLKAKTGFDDKKIRNIVHRAGKMGLVRRTGRGVYII
ncbi:MAG: hypothetical protein KKH68_11335 [Proteobacteria bacterium]|nr:hypothetical protein [Pseudomonadota bacterium]